MALYAANRFPGDGATTSYEFNFVGKYIARAHVKVYQEDNATKVRTYVAINDSNFLNDTTLRSLPVTPVGSTLVIYRDTPRPPLVDFVNGSRFTEYNMDLVARQGLFVAMEAMDAGDSEASQQLRDAIDAVAGLVTGAQAAVSDATAAAAAAATSALNASTSATQAQAALGGAEAANASAQAAKADAQTAATNAAAAAAAVASDLASAGPMQCRVVVVDAASRIVRLERCGGQVVTLGGVVRTLPEAGIQLTLFASVAPRHLYVGWNGSVVFIESVTAPVFNTTLGQWVSPTDSSYAAVAYVRPDALATPERFLRNYYNGPGMSHYSSALTSDYSATWNGVTTQLMQMPLLLLPGDTIAVMGLASIMSTPADRAGDLTLARSGSVLGRARCTHAGATYVWHNYYCLSNTIQRLVTDAPRQVPFELYYTPISTTGSTWTALGDGASTKLIVNITPYKWA